MQRFTQAGERCIVPVISSDASQSTGLASNIQNVRIRHVEVQIFPVPVTRVVLAYGHEALRLVKRQRSQQHRIHHAEHSCSSADSQSNGYDRDDREPGIAAELTNAVSAV